MMIGITHMEAVYRQYTAKYVAKGVYNDEYFINF